MKKKVKFGRDADEALSRNDLSSLTDVDFEKQTHGLVEKVMKKHVAEPCPGTANLTIRLKIPRGNHVGEGDEDEYESALQVMSMRTTMLANHCSKKEFSLLDSSEATCQIEGCTANLSCTNGYFRKNKVCQEHFKAFKVEVGDIEQRFCQQCNRFHMLAEFDEDKRSCRLTLAGHNNRQKRAQPEATSVLSTGTLVYLPGKVKQGGKSLLPASSSACEDLERTITNEETTDSETNLRDDASSMLVYKEKRCNNLELANPTSSQINYMESIGNEKLVLTHMRKDEALLQPLPNPSVSASNFCSSKNSGSKKRSVSQSGHTSMCQVEGCMFDLSNTKDYFKRRKVCEPHFKALNVKVQNVDQRFCQQCSRFHVLAEFDEGRKSCKKMLIGHNMRRRKGHPEAVSRRNTSKEVRKDDCSSLKTSQSLSEISKPSISLGFETSREKTPALTN